MPEHRPRYPPGAFTGPDTRVTPEKYDELVEIVHRLSYHIREKPAQPVRRSEDGWTHWHIGLRMYQPQLPPVVEAPS